MTWKRRTPAANRRRRHRRERAEQLMQSLNAAIGELFDAFHETYRTGADELRRGVLAGSLVAESEARVIGARLVAESEAWVIGARFE